MLRFLVSESGATLVEYGVALVIAIVVGGAGIVALSGQLETNMTDTNTVLQQR